MEKTSPTEYSKIGKLIHWITAILVLVAFILGPGGHEDKIYSAARAAGREWHETLGLSVFALVLIRVIWRAFTVTPELPPIERWMELSAKAVQGLLYALMFALPLTAITGAWLEGHPLTLLGGIEVAPMLSKSHDFGETISEIHTWLGDAILWIAGFHAAAALFHHYILQDNVLRSMLPGWCQKKR